MSSNLDNQPPFQDGVRSQSPQTSRVLSCSECQYGFTSQIFLHKHMKRNHNNVYHQMLRNGQIPSEACQQNTSPATSQKQEGDTDEPQSHGDEQSTATLTQPEVKVGVTHELTYGTGKKTHVCKQCDKSFNRLSHLKTHQLVHTAERPFLCKQCERTFNRLDSLKKHQRIHTGEKPFLCKQCEKTFNRLDGLKQHRRVHSGEKPFRCKQCDKCFSQSGHMKAHQRRHTREKPFHCNQCDKSFTRLDSMKKHEHLHSPQF